MQQLHQALACIFVLFNCPLIRYLFYLSLLSTKSFVNLKNYLFRNEYSNRAETMKYSWCRDSFNKLAYISCKAE